MPLKKVHPLSGWVKRGAHRWRGVPTESRMAKRTLSIFSNGVEWGLWIRWEVRSLGVGDLGAATVWAMHVHVLRNVTSSKVLLTKKTC
jgi:hypothetical protein